MVLVKAAKFLGRLITNFWGSQFEINSRIPRFISINIFTFNSGEKKGGVIFV